MWSGLHFNQNPMADLWRTDLKVPRLEDQLENNNEVLNLSNESRNGEEGSDLRNT